MIKLIIAVLILGLFPGLSYGIFPAVKDIAATIPFKFITPTGTKVTGITITNIDVYLKKEGQTAYTKYDCVTSSPGGTDRICREIGQGVYEVDVTSGDTNTSGYLLIQAQ